MPAQGIGRAPKSSEPTPQQPFAVRTRGLQDLGWVTPLSGRYLTSKSASPQAFKNGEWNPYRVLAQGPRIRTWINDVPAADVFDAEASDGCLGFQVHGVGAKEEPLVVEWRNVRLRKMTRDDR